MQTILVLFKHVQHFLQGRTTQQSNNTQPRSNTVRMLQTIQQKITLSELSLSLFLQGFVYSHKCTLFRSVKQQKNVIEAQSRMCENLAEILTKS